MAQTRLPKHQGQKISDRDYDVVMRSEHTSKGAGSFTISSVVPSGHDGRIGSNAIVESWPIYIHVKRHWQTDVLATGKSRNWQAESLPYVGASISFTEMDGDA